MGRKKVSLLVLALALLAGLVALASRREAPVAVTEAVTPPSTPAVAAEGDPRGFLYGRVTTLDGHTYEGRLRFGGDEEAFWSDYFNGFKDENPWVAHVPRERLATERHSVAIFGLEIAQREREIDFGRPFMARFGDVRCIEARGPDVRVTLKSGTAFDLDRYSASDFDDGVRVWDGRRGLVDLGPRRIRSVELLSTPQPGAAPTRLHGTVRTRQGEFTGFLQWNRREGVGSDELQGHTGDGVLGLRFDTLRSIARHSRDSSRVTLADGREIVLAGTREVGEGNGGAYVDDPRYGRVLVSWEAFERVDFSSPGNGPGGSASTGAASTGPSYGDFPPGRPLNGTVATRDGRHLTGRLVFDLDESETTETLDAPAQGVDYTLPFALVASIVPGGRNEHGTRHATVTLRDGQELHLEPSGDLGENNAGLLIFGDGRDRPNYVSWSDVERIDLDRPPS